MDKIPERDELVRMLDAILQSGNTEYACSCAASIRGTYGLLEFEKKALMFVIPIDSKRPKESPSK